MLIITFFKLHWQYDKCTNPELVSAELPKNN